MEPSLDFLLSSNAGSIVQRRIEFTKAKRPDMQWEKLKSKYKPINAQTNKDSGKHDANNKDGKKSEKVMQEDDLTEPRISLFPEERVAGLLKWKQVKRIGAGLKNLGNTCFMNAVLQCLTYTAPLANYLLQKEHSANCRVKNTFCMFCELEKHITRSISQSNSVVTPTDIARNLKNISKVLKWGRQEDSHEFIRYIVDALQKSSLFGLNTKLETRLGETTVIHRIFGGHLQSQVHCSSCNYKSNTFDPFLDLSLEIKGCDSLERALQKFTSPEILDKANKYKCPSCGKLVQAKKQLSIKKAPNVVTIQLKRFSFASMFGTKIDKHIKFTEKLNLTPYLSNPSTDPHAVYSLYAILVHSGYTSTSGHYYSYVKSSANLWHCMDDSMVTQVSAAKVLNEHAYMLFYIRDEVAPRSQPNTPQPAVDKKRKAEGTRAQEETPIKKPKVENLPNGPKLQSNGHAHPKLVPTMNGNSLPPVQEDEKGEKLSKDQIDQLFRTKKQKIVHPQSPQPQNSSMENKEFGASKSAPVTPKAENGIIEKLFQTPKDEILIKAEKSMNDLLNSNSKMEIKEKMETKQEKGLENGKESQGEESSSNDEVNVTVTGTKTQTVVAWDASTRREWRETQYERRMEAARVAEEGKKRKFEILSQLESNGKLRSWDDKEINEAANLVHSIKKPRDGWDELYDAGKTKKVKIPKMEINQGNVFQKFAGSGQKKQEKYGKKFRRVVRGKDPRFQQNKSNFRQRRVNF